MLIYTEVNSFACLVLQVQYLLQTLLSLMKCMNQKMLFYLKFSWSSLVKINR